MQEEYKRIAFHRYPQPIPNSTESGPGASGPSLLVVVETPSPGWPCRTHGTRICHESSHGSTRCQYRVSTLMQVTKRAHLGPHHVGSGGPLRVRRMTTILRYCLQSPASAMTSRTRHAGVQGGRGLDELLDRLLMQPRARAWQETNSGCPLSPGPSGSVCPVAQTSTADVRGGLTGEGGPVASRP